MNPLLDHSSSKDNPACAAPEVNQAPFLSVVCPCYRDETNLPELHRRLSAVCASLNRDYELILIDDGSPDGTWDVIKTLATADEHVRGLRLSRNYGHQLAVTAGLIHARGRRILIIDSDLEDPPELLPEMMKIMDEGADNVYGVRLSRSGVPAWKRACYKIYYRLLSTLAGCHIPADSGDFRLISRRIADEINRMPEHDRFLRGMISWVGFKQVPFPYHRQARFSGESGYTLAKLIQIATDGVTSFSITPLRLATLLGAAFSFLSLAGAAYIVIFVIAVGRSVPGWASLMVAVLFMGSLQLLVLGIIGEYLGRMFIESKRRPLFLVQEVAGNRENPTRTDNTK